jgi:putative DNA primase/helicase
MNAWKTAKTVARHKIKIVPVPPKEKGCKLADWPERATSDIEQIQQWEQEQPDGNYGVVCTPDTIVVLDADNPGLRSHIERQTDREFPDTLTVKSSKGYHYYFLQTDRTRAIGNRKLAGMFDLQSDRKYVVGPASTHPSGVKYAILNNTDIVPMPDWLADYLDKASTPPKRKKKDGPQMADDFDPDEWYRFNDISGFEDGNWFIPHDGCVVAGYRHEQSTRTGFFYDGKNWGWECFAQGCPGSDMSIGDVVGFVNSKRRDAGLPVWKKPIWQEDDSELQGVDNLDSVEMEELIPTPLSVASSAEVSQTEAQEAPKSSSGLKSLASTSNDDFDLMLVTRSAADYEMEELRWLWPQKIPSGKMVLYTGKPDGGKTMCALDVAARVTRGSDWPDGSRNENGMGRVLIASSEDDPKDTLVPRLKAAGADLNNIEIVVGTVLSAKGKRKKKTLNLKRDAVMLLEAIKANPDIKLLILDPIISFFGDADMNKDKDVRPITDDLKATCEKSGLTVIGIVHSSKRSDVDAVHKVSGAGSLVASARAVWGFSRDTEDKSKFHMAHVKGNLTRDKSGLDYTIEEALVTIQGKPVGVPHTVWGGKFEGDADDLLDASRERKDKVDYKANIAKAYLRTVKYPVKAMALYEQAERAEGLSSDVLKKAKVRLWAEGFQIVVKKQHDGWYWFHKVDGELVRDTQVTIDEVGGFNE